ncbi:MAG TPA: NAD+ synthase [Candidatus Eisenbacteria bacterium]|nr:NAD+ synthase [Candidatus Eisenbacteria bacterium]
MTPAQGAPERAQASRVVRLALAQVNPVVGDLPGNAKKVIDFLDRARAQGADLVAFPELVLTGYPPEDLLLRPEFIEQNQAALDEVVRATRGITAIVGFAQRAGDVYNAAAIAHDGQLVAVYQKSHLPNYGVFDEVRYFRPGRDPFVCVRGPLRFAVNICEDIWTPSGPMAFALYGEAELVINLSASPFHAGKSVSRDRMLATRAADGVSFVAFVNNVGGQDELVFDGNSRVFGPRGEDLARAAAFEEDLVLVDLDLDAIFRARLKDPRSREAAQTDNGEAGLRSVTLPAIAPGAPVPATKPPLAPRKIHTPADVEEVYQALVLGTRDYIQKNRFGHVVLGLSGGVDSALTAAIAADALGAENVTGVFLPSPFTSRESAEDAEALARSIGIGYMTLPIGDEMASYKKTLAEAFKGRAEDTTEENIQSRIRGNILMALSNKFGWLVLTTGNKSEYSCGYATLYGDMAGGFAVLKDVFKTLVYDLVRYRNARAGKPWIPERTVTRPPTAELKPGQFDTDSLPPYDVLDPILRAYVEEDWEVDRIVGLGYDRALVRRVIQMVDKAEYKRRQAPPGIRITARALGKDRRLPITNRHQPWRD